MHSIHSNMNMSIAEWNRWWNDLDKTKRAEIVNRQARRRQTHGQAAPLSPEAHATRDKFMREAGR